MKKEETAAELTPTLPATKQNGTAKEIVRLSKEVAEKYELAGVGGGVVILQKKWGGATVNFSTMTLAQAEKLVALKVDKETFPYLKEKSK